ncbi:sugar phosphate isomerase/epimerase family protein [Geomonas oryzae]|uniref:sugar phosphate isomerase/epimerase family protein n=1 Tax=Geomonas oryzae TaxID=2364273 RepID=UPI00100C1A65|nr:TIM barrel protein [Geomonas oryzae]
MRVAISNLAWDVTLDTEVAALLRRHEIDAIDIAPGKYFPDFCAASGTDLSRVRNWWGDKGITITGMQALLYGTTGLNLFGTDAQQDAMLSHMGEVCRIASGLGATRLAFGSPKNRDRSCRTDAETRDIAHRFFSRLGDIAASRGVLVCLEPNPPCYGANFMTTTAEAAQVVADVAHPAIRLLFDTGACTINGEDVGAVCRAFAPLIGHIHLSEPHLVVLGDGETDHAKAADEVAAFVPERVACIEMLPPKDEPALAGIERGVQVALAHYRRGEEGRLP